MRKTLFAILTSVGLLLGVGVTVAPAAQAASYSETFNCSGSTGSDGIWRGGCVGPWYAGTPGVRTAYIDADNISYWPSGFRTTLVHSVTSVKGYKQVYEWRCAFDDGTTSSLKGTTTVGGGAANSFTWAGNGYSPCSGQMGLEVNIFATYGNHTYLTQVWINAPKSKYAKKWHGNQSTA